MNEKDIDCLNAKVSNGSSYVAKKAVYHLPVPDADIVIRKRTWERATKEEYLRRKIKAS